MHLRNELVTNINNTLIYSKLSESKFRHIHLLTN